MITHFSGYPNPIQWESEHISKQSAQLYTKVDSLIERGLISCAVLFKKFNHSYIGWLLNLLRPLTVLLSIHSSNGILLPKLLWPTVRKNCSIDREKLFKFEAEGREFAKFLRSLEQFVWIVKGQNNFW